MKNPYHESVEKAWRLGFASETGLAAREGVAAVLSLGFAGVGVICVPMGVGAILDAIESSSLESAVLKLIYALGYFGLTWGMSFAANKMHRVENSLKKISYCSGSVSEKTRELAESSAAAREWKEDAAWSGRELRMFDYDAMKKVAELETKGELRFWGAGAESAKREPRL